MNVDFISHLNKRIDRVNVDGLSKLLKPSNYIDTYEQPLAACELICYNLLQLLKSKGININTPKVEPWIPDRFITSNYNIRYMNPVVIIDDVGIHTQIKSDEVIENAKVPDWIYYFDRWVGRLDGDSNLLLLPNNEVISIDYELCFPWVCTKPPVYKKINDLDVKYNPMIKQSASEKSKQIIKSLSDNEIWSVVTNVPKEMIASSTLVGIWSGLCERKKLL